MFTIHFWNLKVLRTALLVQVLYREVMVIHSQVQGEFMQRHNKADESERCKS